MGLGSPMPDAMAGFAPRIEHARRHSARVFVAVLALTTLLPWLVMPFLATRHGDHAFTFRRLVGLAGPMHVLSTFALYLDPGIRPLIARSKRRFVFVPIALLVTVPAFCWLAPTRLSSLAFLALIPWATHHLARQNIGVLAFAHSARGQGSLDHTDRKILTTVGASGGIAVIGYSEFLRPAGLSVLSTPLLGASLLVFAAAFVPALPRLWQRRRDPVCCLMYLQSVVFFLPLFFIVDLLALPYSVAHNVQYLVFMAYLVKHRSGPRRALNANVVAAALALTIVGGPLVRYLYELGSLPLLGLITAVGAIHYLMDASIWRLGQPLQRAYATERFAFLGH